MIKKLLAVFLVFSFLNFTLLPNYAFGETTKVEEWEERDKAQTQALLIMGLAALYWMALNMPKSSYKSSNLTKEKNKDLDALNKIPKKEAYSIDVTYNLGILKSSLYNNSLQAKDSSFEPTIKQITPTLMVNLNW
jgi:hypothetical protein